jgi:hypothetical protein
MPPPRFAAIMRAGIGDLLGADGEGTAIERTGWRGDARYCGQTLNTAPSAESSKTVST